MRRAVIDELINESESADDILLMTGDLGFNLLEPFVARHPDRFINAGIAEQNMVGVAAGLAATGFRCVCYSIVNFGLLRALEQFRNDVIYHQLPVAIVVAGAGFSYGQLGFSHHGSEDVSIIRALGNGVDVYCPSTTSGARAAISSFLARRRPSYIRLDRGPGVARDEDSLITLRSRPADGSTGRNGKSFTFPYRPAILRTWEASPHSDPDVILGVTGTMEEVAVGAAQLLAMDGVSVDVYSFDVLQPIDESYVAKRISGARLLATVEEHTVVGGLGSLLLETVSNWTGTVPPLLRLGLQGKLVDRVGDQRFLREVYGLSPVKVKDAVQSRLDRLP